MKTEIAPLVYSVPEVAELLKVSPQTVWAMVWDGRLFSVTIRARRLVPRAALEALVNGPTSPAGANG